MIPFIDFKPLADFSDRTGIVRSIYGCTPLGRLEFWERIEQINSLLKQESAEYSWEEVYQLNAAFRHQVNRCLELNGIDPEWLTFAHVEAFLFHRLDPESEEFRPGWLLELNSPPKSEQKPKTDGEVLTVEELVAAIALTVGNTKEALELASTVRPADSLLGVIEAQSEMKDSEARERKKRKRTSEKIKKKLGEDELKRLINTPVEQLRAEGLIKG